MTLIQSCEELFIESQLCTQNRLARLSCRWAELGSRPLGGPLAPPGANRLPRAPAMSFPPGGTNPTAMGHARPVFLVSIA